MSNYGWKAIKHLYHKTENLIESCPWRKKNQNHCDHAAATVTKWLEKGTPMVEVTCFECGFHDRGPVYADPVDWVEHLP